jgi:hypothetical protein
LSFSVLLYIWNL